MIHAAGIPGNGSIGIRQDAHEVPAVLSPKVVGLSVLVQLLGDTPLAFVALMSSINSVIGAPGASSYTAANAVLDAFVMSETRPTAWKQVVSINWGAWRDVGMAANLVVPQSMRSQQEAFLETAIETEAGVDAFARILGSGHDRFVVTTFDLAALSEADRKRAESATKLVRNTTTTTTHSNQSAVKDPPTTDVERLLAGILVGTDRCHKYWRARRLLRPGGHSLLATRVIARVSATLGARLTLRDVFNTPTIRSLAEQVTAVHSQEDAKEDRGDRDLKNAEELLGRLHSAGVEIAASDGRLHVTAERGVITEKIKQEIAAHKEGLIKALTERPHRGRVGADLPFSALDRTSPIPLSFAQQRLWFLAQLEGASEAYHIQFIWKLKGRLDSRVLRCALDRIAYRHEALRTTFSQADGEPVQRIAPASTGFFLAEHDLRGRPDGVAEELNRLCALNLSARFDLERGPLIRGLLIRLSEDEHTLLITMHHIISDGWSMAVFADELKALYTAFLEGRA